MSRTRHDSQSPKNWTKKEAEKNCSQVSLYFTTLEWKRLLIPHTYTLPLVQYSSWPCVCVCNRESDSWDTGVCVRACVSECHFFSRLVSTTKNQILQRLTKCHDNNTFAAKMWDFGATFSFFLFLFLLLSQNLFLCGFQNFHFHRAAKKLEDSSSFWRTTLDD